MELRFILSYPTHFHNHVTPKLGLTLQNQNCFSKWDTISNVSAKKKRLLLRGRKKALWKPPLSRKFHMIFLDLCDMFYVSVLMYLTPCLYMFYRGSYGRLVSYTKYVNPL